MLPAARKLTIRGLEETDARARSARVETKLNENGAAIAALETEVLERTKRAKELWRLKVKLHGNSGTASEFYKKAKENKQRRLNKQKKAKFMTI